MAKDLNSILKSAQFLMTEEGQRQIDFAAKNNNFDEGMDLSTHVPSQYQGAGRVLKETKTQKFDKSKADILGLPASVVAAMEADYAEGGALSNLNSKILSEGGSGSVLDTFVPQQPSAPKQPVNEIRYEQPRYNPQPTNNNGIDYTIIKAIVEECIKRNMEEIKQNILSESTLKTVKLANGNKIQLVDNKGNLYESTLTFKKNIAKK